MSQSQKSPALEAERSESGVVLVSEKHFYGRPCKNCGGTVRYRRNKACVACARAQARVRGLLNDPGSERRKARQRARYATDPEYRKHVLAKTRERREINLQNPEWVERERRRQRDQYENLDHIAYYGRQLKSRRYMALKRKEARHNGSLSDEG